MTRYLKDEYTMKEFYRGYIGYYIGIILITQGEYRGYIKYYGDYVEFIFPHFLLANHQYVAFGVCVADDNHFGKGYRVHGDYRGVWILGLRVSQNLGYHFEGPHNKDHCILGSILGSTLLRSHLERYEYGEQISRWP